MTAPDRSIEDAALIAFVRSELADSFERVDYYARNESPNAAIEWSERVTHFHVQRVLRDGLRRLQRPAPIAAGEDRDDEQQ